MSWQQGFPFHTCGLDFHGVSVAGISTSIAMPKLDLVFDVAQGYTFQMPINHIFITHGHMDHASGIPYLLSQKAMLSQAKPHVYMPESLIEPMSKIMTIWSEIEGHSYEYTFVPSEIGKNYPLKPPYFCRAFPTLHRVPSNGYTVFERKKQLKSEFQNLSQQQIAQLSNKGTTVSQQIEVPLVSFTGDTQIEFFDLAPEVLNSRVLFCEASFLDDERPVASARKWGHLHLDELVARLAEFKGEKIVLIHVSARYTTPVIREILSKKVSPELLAKIEIFPRPL